MDLVWKLVKAKYEGDIPMPSDLWFIKPKDTRSAKQIIKDTMNGLGGE